MKKLVFIVFALAVASCASWRGPTMDSEDFPMRVGAVHIYRMQGYSQGDSMVVTTMDKGLRDGKTIYRDSIAYFIGDLLNYSTKVYYELTDNYFYYRGDETIGYLEDAPVPLIDFPLYEGKIWYEDSEDTLGKYWECVDYDDLWIDLVHYEAFCVQPSNTGDGGIARYWYAKDVGLVKYGKSDLSGVSITQELVAYYPDGLPEDTTGGDQFVKAPNPPYPEYASKNQNGSL